MDQWIHANLDLHHMKSRGFHFKESLKPINLTNCHIPLRSADKLREKTGDLLEKNSRLCTMKCVKRGTILHVILTEIKKKRTRFTDFSESRWINRDKPYNCFCIYNSWKRHRFGHFFVYQILPYTSLNLHKLPLKKNKIVIVYMQITIIIIFIIKFRTAPFWENYLLFSFCFAKVHSKHGKHSGTNWVSGQLTGGSGDPSKSNTGLQIKTVACNETHKM